MIFLLEFFSMPTGSLDAITFYISDTISAIGPFLWLAIGIPLGFYVIKKVIGLLPKGK